MQVTMATSPATPDQPNEDFTAATPNGVVLLDGAGLSGTTSRCSHGVAWYTRHLGGALLTGLAGDDGQDLAAILAEAIRQTADAHEGTCDLDDPGTPSATVVMLRTTGDDLEYLVLADSVLVLNLADDAPLVITDDREAHIGQRYRSAMDNLTNGTPEHDQARRDYVQALRAHRNTAGGFWVAAADPRAADEAILGSRPITSAALLSDGASRLTDRFALTDWPGLLAILHDHGPAELIRRVRAAEDSDLQGIRWPRGKTHDDATAAYYTQLFDRQEVWKDQRRVGR
ncbi:protein phosphatase 2C domain-containing protein [Micromonospora sp. PLK6-60]|uniref:protein phosphatase 2C domain-containing protein n=1 Tax=Micromonospora sp. PLK6-60 TaxID=2873383 RepID=UPI001CA61FEF|nr:protein phosphatase 2C domain-containing protein [Micromonospora sp. PLK6-60]MBY8873769.1 protein phosphatase 2C domain-containing protein [Micromonospora sp. PLK6-60]